MTTPPSGRATKPTAKVRKDSIRPENGSTSGKKSFGKTRAAITPYRKKSYHSMVVPTVLATTASIRTLLSTGASDAVAGSIDASPIRDSLSRQFATDAVAVGVQLGRGPARWRIRKPRTLDGVAGHDQRAGLDDHVAGLCLRVGDRLSHVLHQGARHPRGFEHLDPMPGRLAAQRGLQVGLQLLRVAGACTVAGVTRVGGEVCSAQGRAQPAEKRVVARRDNERAVRRGIRLKRRDGRVAIA